MMRGMRLSWMVTGAVLLAAVLFGRVAATRLQDASVEHTLEVTRGALEVWSSHACEIQPERMALIATTTGGGATLVELAPEGITVAAGDVLARFDSTDLDRQVLKLEEEVALAGAELEGLELATLPVERAELEAEAAAARNAYEREQRFLAETDALRREGLMSAEEADILRAATEELRRKAGNLARKLELTVRYLHPSRLQHQRAKLESAQQALALARAQLAGAIVRAPADGVVIYRMLQIGPEFRSVRIGDVLAPNQPFMMLPDLSQLLAHCNVPESELALARPGSAVRVRPLAFPALTLPGVVRRVGGVAQSVPGRPSWQRFFTVEIELQDAAPELRPGMSVTADVLAYSKTDAVLIPRTAVRWEAGRPLGDFETLLSRDTRELQLGYADEKHYEVIAGAEPGDRVLPP